MSESTLVKMPHCWKSHVAAHTWLLLVRRSCIIQYIVQSLYSAMFEVNRPDLGLNIDHFKNEQKLLKMVYIIPNFLVLHLVKIS